MNTLQFTLLLFGMGLFMVLLAFAVMYGISSVLGLSEDFVDFRLLFAYFVVATVVLYGISFGVFAGVQTDSCGEVKNWKQIAMNAAIPMLTQVALFTLVFFVPWFQRVVGDMFPPETPAFGKTAATYAYYSFWATLLGASFGGSLSGSCKQPDIEPVLTFPDLQTLPSPESIGTVLPPEGS